ncbi:MAG: hypothetical protein A2293_02815 [Elusimicrobia bacterium RIFOXYB2_FULL_49_7]|nr:MAG: hypothetical protein A2293_02815 [Elusimicrobia bacterium RIFOXYB2_FULL_49_7]
MITLEIIKVDGLPEMAEKSFSFMRPGSVALSGGKTYAPVYPFWGQQPHPTLSRFFPVDERQVPITDPESNWGMADRFLFQPWGATGSRDHFAASAESYRKLLEQEMGPGLPLFDLVFLGVGADGHIASLFPNDPRINETGHSVLETHSPLLPHARITLSLEVLVRAKEAVILLFGPEKAPLIPRILAGDSSLPAGRLIRQRPKTILIAEKNLFADTEKFG